MQTVILMLTNSFDATSDLLVQCVGSARVFRLNIDQWDAYEILVGHGYLRLTDPTGRSVCQGDIQHVYWRKPFDPSAVFLQAGTVDSWKTEQRRYLVTEVYNLLTSLGVPALVEAHAERRVGKLVQMTVAAKWFSVPEWVIWQGKMPRPTQEGRWLVKSLFMEPVGQNQFLYATETHLDELDPAYQWFCQRCVDATHDVTIVYVLGRCHAFELNRSSFDGADWRVHLTDLRWVPTPLVQEETTAVCGLMAELRLGFGRLDFVRDRDGTLQFLEVNPNGQFAWLDENGKHGLIGDLVRAITTEPFPR